MFMDGMGYMGQIYIELCIKLFVYCMYVVVVQVIDVINFCFLVDQVNQIFYDRDDVFVSKYQCFFINIQFQFVVDFVVFYFFEVVMFIGEEQFIDDIVGGFFIGWICIVQLLVDILYCFYFRIGRVFLQCIVYNGVILVNFIFLQDNCFGFCIEDKFNIVFVEYNILFQDNFILFNGNYFIGIFIYEIFRLVLQYLGSQFMFDSFFEFVVGSRYFVCKVEDIENGFICIIFDCLYQCCYWEFFFMVDVSIYYCIDVGGEFYLCVFEGDYMGRIDFGFVGVEVLFKEYFW